MSVLICRLVLQNRCISQSLLHLPSQCSLPLAVCSFSTSQTCMAGYRIQDNIRDCYSLLNVSEGCSQEEAKQAYLNMAKLYHPDSQSSTADSKKFNQVKEAYKTIKTKLEERDALSQYYVDNDDDDDDELGIRPVQAQHRQYLDNEGVGYGNRAQRQKQFEQLRVSKAQQNVFKYKIKRIMPEGDNALVVKDQKAAKKTKMSNTIDRLVEDMIQESMSKGHFDNLPGAGKPLDFSKEIPYMDRTTQILNQILLDEDLLPGWISKQKEIRTDFQKCQEKLALDTKRLQEYSSSKDKEKNVIVIAEAFKASLEDINIKIFNFNLIVPMLNKQMMPYNFEKEYKKVCSNIEEYLLKDTGTSAYVVYGNEYKSEQTVSFKDIWTGVKDIFKIIKKS